MNPPIQPYSQVVLYRTFEFGTGATGLAAYLQTQIQDATGAIVQPWTAVPLPTNGSNPEVLDPNGNPTGSYPAQLTISLTWQYPLLATAGFSAGAGASGAGQIADISIDSAPNAVTTQTSTGGTTVATEYVSDGTQGATPATIPTLQYVQALLSDDNFPVEDIAVSQVVRAMERALIDYGQMLPVIRTAQFTTVIGQNQYDLFNPNAPEYIGDSEGLYVLKVIWTQGIGATTDLDPFGIVAFLQASMASYGTYPKFSFTTPGDYLIFSNNLVQWNNRYNGDFQQTGNQSGEPILLVPPPTTTVPVFVTYASRRNIELLTPEMLEVYNYLVEARVCDMLARMYSQLAGMTIGNYKDSTKTDQFWRDEAKSLRKSATALIGDYSFEGYVAATRS